MALTKRGKTWHCHFVVNGQRFRQSLGTRDWREAQSKEKELIGQAMEGKLTQTSMSLARQPFGIAADEYVIARKLELACASQAKEKQLLVQLRAFFKQALLKSITAKRINEYRAWRAEQKVGPAKLNAELGILRRILKRARIWARVADDIRPLREPTTIGKALTEEEKQRLLKTAVMRPEWETAYLRRHTVSEYDRKGLRTQRAAMVGCGPLQPNPNNSQVQDGCGRKDCATY